MSSSRPLVEPCRRGAGDRPTHRIGQTSKVMVYRLISGGTIEEKVLACRSASATSSSRSSTTVAHCPVRSRPRTSRRCCARTERRVAAGQLGLPVRLVRRMCHRRAQSLDREVSRRCSRFQSRPEALRPSISRPRWDRGDSGRRQRGIRPALGTPQRWVVEEWASRSPGRRSSPQLRTVCRERTSSAATVRGGSAFKRAPISAMLDT